MHLIMHVFYENFEFFWKFRFFFFFFFWNFMKFWNLLGIRYRVWYIGYKRYRLGTIIDNAYTKHLYFNLNIWYYYLLHTSNKGIFVWPIWPEVNCPYFHTPGKWPVIGLLQDHFHIEAHMANMGLDFVSGQYGCLFSRCRKYVINSLIHGHFHIGLVIIPRRSRGPIWVEG